MTWSYCTAFAGGVAVRKCLRAAAAHRWYLLFNKSTTTTLPLNVNFFHISSNQEARLIAMERLPAYVEDQVPQNAFDALLTRIISSPAILRLPDARIILETYVEGQRAPPYHLYDAASFPSPRPIEEYPADPDLSMLVPDPTLICIKQRIVEELFRAIWREDDESVALLIQNNLVTANTTHKGGLTPLLAAVLANVMPIVKQLLVLGADPNKFGVMTVSAPSHPFALLIHCVHYRINRDVPR